MYLISLSVIFLPVNGLNINICSRLMEKTHYRREIIYLLKHTFNYCFLFFFIKNYMICLNPFPPQCLLSFHIIFCLLLASVPSSPSNGKVSRVPFGSLLFDQIWVLESLSAWLYLSRVETLKWRVAYFYSFSSCCNCLITTATNTPVDSALLFCTLHLSFSLLLHLKLHEVGSFSL